MKVSAPQARRSYASPPASATFALPSSAFVAANAPAAKPASGVGAAQPRPPGHEFGKIDIFPTSAAAQPIQRFPDLETARRKWLPTALGGYTPAQVRQKENREATVRKIKAQQARAQGQAKPAAKAPAKGKSNPIGVGLNLIAEPDLSGDSSVSDVVSDMAARTTAGATYRVAKAARHLYKAGDENNYLKLGSAEGQVVATPGVNRDLDWGAGRMKANASLVDARVGSKNLYLRGQLGGVEASIKGQSKPALASRAYYASGEFGASANIGGFNPYLKVTGSVGHDLQEPFSMPYKDKSGLRVPMGPLGDLKVKVGAGLNWSKPDDKKKKNG